MYNIVYTDNVCVYLNHPLESERILLNFLLIGFLLLFILTHDCLCVRHSSFLYVVCCGKYSHKSFSRFVCKSVCVCAYIYEREREREIFDL